MLECVWWTRTVQCASILFVGKYGNLLRKRFPKFEIVDRLVGRNVFTSRCVRRVTLCVSPSAPIRVSPSLGALNHINDVRASQRL